MKKSLIYLMMTTALLGCGNDEGDTSTLQPEPSGRWLKGDIHFHTQASDGHASQTDIMAYAVDTFGLDYLIPSNHLRNQASNPYLDGEDPHNAKQNILFSHAQRDYEIVEIARLAPQYPQQIVYSSFEWDTPKQTFDHMSIGMIGKDWQQVNDFTRLFEYKFSNTNTLADFDGEDLQVWNAAGETRHNQTKEDVLYAMAWLQQHYPDTSYLQLNHGMRDPSTYTIADLRRFNDIAPDVFFTIEGLPGNQFNDRGEYQSPNGDPTLAGTLSGVDPMVARVGGWWDALLGEGRKIWIAGNSDFHFKTGCADGTCLSGYWPGEYTKNYTYVEGEGPVALLKALRSGNSFAVFGDLIDSLNYRVEINGQSAANYHTVNQNAANQNAVSQSAAMNDSAGMGQTLVVKPGDQITLYIDFTSPEFNNQEVKVNDGNYQGLNPGVHHIDLISGKVGVKATVDSPAYDVASNDSTQIIKSFTEDDWVQNEAGVYQIKYQFIADTHRYFRLRGTNLDYNQQDADGNPIMINGEPQYTKKITKEGLTAEAFVNKVNARNYSELWFYSNPLFIQVN
ncbi:MAG: hypothetical protein ACRDBI_13910 [Shewanella sp.]